MTAVLVALTALGALICALGLWVAAVEGLAVPAAVFVALAVAIAANAARALTNPKETSCA